MKMIPYWNKFYISKQRQNTNIRYKQIKIQLYTSDNRKAIKLDDKRHNTQTNS